MNLCVQNRFIGRNYDFPLLSSLIYPPHSIRHDKESDSMPTDRIFKNFLSCIPIFVG